MEYARASATGVDKRRRAALSRHLRRIRTQRSSAPVDMRVEIDQPRCDEQPTHVHDFTAARGEVGPDFAYLSITEGDIGLLVAPARWVDDASLSIRSVIRTPYKTERWHQATIRAPRLAPRREIVACAVGAARWAGHRPCKARQRFPAIH